MPAPPPSVGAGDGREPLDTRAIPSLPTRLPLLTFAALLAVVIVHLIVEDRQGDIHDTVSGLVMPARASAQAYKTAKAVETAALRGYLLTGDRSFLDDFFHAYATERRRLDELAEYATRLGGEWPDRAAALAARSAAWHARIVESRALAEGAQPESGRGLVGDPSAYRELIQRADEIQSDLMRLESALWTELNAVSRLELGLTSALALLALVAAFLIWWSSRRFHRLAVYLGRRAEEERTFRELARELAAAPGPDELTTILVDGAFALTDLAAAYVERIEADGEWIRVAAASGRGAPRVGERAPYAESLTARVVERGEPEQFTSVETIDSPLTESLATVCRGCSALALPLVADGRGLGALVLVRGAAYRPFYPSDIARLLIVGQFASLALFRAVLLQEARQREEEEAKHAAREAEQRDTAEKIMRRRATFVRGISHDLKNPLGAIIGYADLLESGLKGDLMPEQRESIHRIGQVARSTLRLIHDLVDLSRAEAGELQVERTVVDMAAVIRDAVDENRTQAESKGLRIEVEIAVDLPKACGDPDRVRQILGNLLSNAVKYTEEGEIRVSADTRSATIQNRSGTWIAAAVSDTGPGIPPEECEWIFEEYTRLASKRPDGSGLGLAISRTLARIMGGDVTVQSKLGQGSTFILWLPICASSA